MNDPIVGACQRYIATAKDETSKPRHVNNARAELIALLCRGMDDAQIADAMAWGRVRQKLVEHESHLPKADHRATEFVRRGYHVR